MWGGPPGPIKLHLHCWTRVRYSSGKSACTAQCTQLRVSSGTYTEPCKTVTLSAFFSCLKLVKYDEQKCFSHCGTGSVLLANGVNKKVCWKCLNSLGWWWKAVLGCMGAKLDLVLSILLLSGPGGVWSSGSHWGTSRLFKEDLLINKEPLCLVRLGCASQTAVGIALLVRLSI